MEQTRSINLPSSLGGTQSGRGECAAHQMRIHRSRKAIFHRERVRSRNGRMFQFKRSTQPKPGRVHGECGSRQAHGNTHAHTHSPQLAQVCAPCMVLNVAFSYYAIDCGVRISNVRTDVGGGSTRRATVRQHSHTHRGTQQHGVFALDTRALCASVPLMAAGAGACVIHACANAYGLFRDWVCWGCCIDASPLYGGCAT